MLSRVSNWRNTPFPSHSSLVVDWLPESRIVRPTPEYESRAQKDNKIKSRHHRSFGLLSCWHWRNNFYSTRHYYTFLATQISVVWGIGGDKSDSQSIVNEMLLFSGGSGWSSWVSLPCARWDEMRCSRHWLMVVTVLVTTRWFRMNSLKSLFSQFVFHLDVSH